MNNSDWWKKRVIEREKKWTKKSEQVINNDIADEYKRSLQHIRTSINNLYARFSSDNGISIKDAKKLLTGDEFKSWRMDISDYVAQIEKTGDKGLLLELNTLAMRSRISRLEKLYGDTLMTLDRMGRNVSKSMKDFFEEGYKDNYYHNLHEMGCCGVRIPISAVEPKNMENVMRENWSGKHYSKRLWNNTTKLAQNLKSEIANGIHRGASIDEMSRHIADKMDVGIAQSRRLVRTEMNYVNNQANFDSIIESGMSQFRFVATLDRRTSRICQNHDGNVYDIADAEPGENVPPLHPNCRSTIIGELTGIDRRKFKRTGKDKEGDYIEVSSNMPYNVWYKKFVGEKPKPAIPVPATATPKSESTIKPPDLSIEGMDKPLELLEQMGIKCDAKALSRLGAKNRDEHCEILYKLEQQYKIHENLPFDFGGKMSMRRAKGECGYSYRHTFIRLNGSYLKNTKSYIDDLKYEIDVKFKMPIDESNYKFYTLVHEYGHAIHNAYIHRAVESYDKIIKEYNHIMTSMYKTPKDAMSIIFKKYRVEPIIKVRSKIIKRASEIAGISENEVIEKFVSQYGQSNQFEFFAEAFVHSQLTKKPNPIGQAMLEWLKEEGFLK